ncbi:MAG: hypothetical protein IKX49_03195 [Clostridia bacterium]|nr:hypothetical protein [Clostridia bacterium]MBP5754543.1 hypothetical protein [Clostridia bacterium]MBR5031693.1 hypothetical protein [Clostridia bacterium]
MQNELTAAQPKPTYNAFLRGYGKAQIHTTAGVAVHFCRQKRTYVRFYDENSKPRAARGGNASGHQGPERERRI